MRLAFTSAKYAPKEITVDNIDTPVKVEMEPQAYQLKEMVVKAPDVRVKGDTESTSLVYLLSSRSTIGGDINFRLDYDLILSTGLYDLAALAENHLSGYKQLCR